MVKIISEKEIEEFLGVLRTRGDISDSPFRPVVMDILKNVKINKDKALFEYVNKFDSKDLNPSNFIVTSEEMEKAYLNLDSTKKDIIDTAYARIYDFHTKQKEESWFFEGKNGEIMGARVTPIENVCVYVPGGKAQYPSSVLMNCIPAKIAGVKNLYMATPSKTGKISEMILACAYLAGVKQIYMIGGAQAIAALTYGTESVKRVDKIVGPGNIFVTLAKKEVFGQVGIDSIAGPSEILVIADSKANPKFVAADLLSQAEHDELASGILITDSADLAKKVQEYTTLFVNEKLTRKGILADSIKNYCRIILVDDLKEAASISNKIAPEHLELEVENPFAFLKEITNAGCIFMGYYSPEALGDYMAGSNHVLPTNSTARFFSPLGVYDFIKRSSIVNFNKEAFDNIASKVVGFALEEGLDGHALSVEVRCDD